MKKIKYIGKIVAVSIASILFLSMMSGVSACERDSDLIAGQHTVVGNVHVSHQGPDLIITYTTDGCWLITETHLAVATSLNGIPHNNKGNPKIGHFQYKSEHDPGEDVVTHTIHLVDLGLSPSYSGLLYIAAHAVVYCDCDGRTETAWADNALQFPGNSWALYFIIDLGAA